MGTLNIVDINTITTEYSIASVNGVDCIAWEFRSPNPNSSSRQETDRRKKIKDAVATYNPDVIMLDSRSCGARREYCDALMYSTHIDLWVKLFHEYYENNVDTCSVVENDLGNGSAQYTWIEGDHPLISMTVYPSKKKILVQPGMQLEKNLINWIAAFGVLLPKICSLSHTKDAPTEPGDGKDESAREAGITVSPQSSIMFTSQRQSFVSQVEPPLECIAFGESAAVECGLVVNLPAPTPIVNELLCFIQNKVDQLPFDSIVQLCSDFYSCEVVLSAKQLLYKTVPVKSRLVTRKGANKSKMNISDMVKVFLEMELAHTPIFVARNLSELPPLKMDCMDSLRVLHELESMKAQIKYVTTSQLELVQLIKPGAPLDLNIVNSTDVSAPPDMSREPPQDEIDVTHPLRPDTVNLDEDGIVTDCDLDISTRSESDASDVDVQVCLTEIPSDSRTPSDGDTHIYTVDVEQPQHSVTRPDCGVTGSAFQESNPGALSGARPKTSTARTHQSGSRVFTRSDIHRRQATQLSYSQVAGNRLVASDHGHRTITQHTHVHNRNRKTNVVTGTGTSSRIGTSVEQKPDVVIGTGNSSYIKGLGGATRLRSDEAGNPNRVVTGVFVSRLPPRCSPAQLAAHVKDVCGVKTKPEKIKSKYDSCNSFYIRCTHNVRATLMQPSSWPQNTLIKYYIE